jgi:hypothetical protein
LTAVTGVAELVEAAEASGISSLKGADCELVTGQRLLTSDANPMFTELLLSLRSN